MQQAVELGMNVGIDPSTCRQYITPHLSTEGAHEKVDWQCKKSCASRIDTTERQHTCLTWYKDMCAKQF